MNMIYFNGSYKTESNNLISPYDSGLTTGIGIFDSMLAVDGALQHAAAHYARIIHNAKTVIGLTPEWRLEEFENICLKLLKDNNLSNGFARIRTTITGGVVAAPLARAEKITQLISVGEALNPKEMSPIKCAIITDFPRVAGCVLENCKRLDYTRSYAARRAAEKLGAAEAILTNTHGNIACAATSNIFIEEDGALITPPLGDGVLAGVTRAKLIEEREVKEESIPIKRLKSADKIYLTNSFIGLREAIL